MPRGRITHESPKKTKEKKDKRKERELRKLSDFWSKVTGDIIGPRRRMRSYRTNEKIRPDTVANHDAEQIGRDRNKQKVPKLRISLRKEATIRFEDRSELSSTESSKACTSTSFASCDLSDDTELDTDVQTNMGDSGGECMGDSKSYNVVHESNEYSNELTEGKHSKAKYVGKIGTCNIDSRSCMSTSDSGDELQAEEKHNTVFSKCMQSCIKTEHRPCTDQSQKKQNKLGDPSKCKTKWEGQASYIHIPKLKSNWDTQLLCTEKEEHNARTNHANVVKDLGNSIYLPEESDIGINKACCSDHNIDHLEARLGTSAVNNEVNCNSSCKTGSRQRDGEQMSQKAISSKVIKDKTSGELCQVKTATQSPQVAQVKLLTRSKTRTPKKYGLKASREELFKCLPEPSPRKRKQVDMGILADVRLAKSACSLWFSECRRQYQQRHPKAGSHQLDVLMREGWDQLTARHRLPYFVRAQSALDDRQQHREIKEHRKKCLHKEIQQECTLENFLNLSIHEQDASLKRGLYDLQKRLSRAHYEAFLETVMFQLIPEAASIPDKNIEKSRGLCLAREELYKALLAMQSDIVSLNRETKLVEDTKLLQEYHEDIGNILNSSDAIKLSISPEVIFPMEKMLNCDLIPKQSELHVLHSDCHDQLDHKPALLTNEENNQENSQLQYDHYSPRPAQLIVTDLSPESKHCESFENPSTYDTTIPCSAEHGGTGNVLTEPKLEFSKTSHPTYSNINENNSNFAHRENGQRACADTPNLGHDDRGGSGDAVYRDIRHSPTYRDILNYLKFGSVTGTLKMQISGEDWIMPNVVDREMYKDTLFHAITQPLPELNADSVDDYFDNGN